VNSKRYELEVEPWATLLDLLREHLHLTGTRKGCGRGQCGACTMLADGVRMSAGLAPAAVYDGCVSGFTA
jgi:xanthine dehydrogenase YagT iron-sulfur-binding subunit